MDVSPSSNPRFATPRRMSRGVERSSLRSIAASAVAIVALTSCSFVSEDAARVGDDALSNGDFYELLDGYAKATQTGFLPSGNVDAEIARLILLDWISTSVLDGTLVEYGVEISQADLDQAAASLDRQVGFESAPRVVRDFYIRATAVRTVAGETFSPSTEELADLYATGPEQSGVVCLRLILTEGREEIDAALARIEAGESFAEVSAEVSIDPSSEIGGVLRNNQTGDECFPYDEVVQRIVEQIAEVIPESRPGVVQGPIEVPDLGWIAVLLRPFTEVTDDAVKIAGPITASRLTSSALDSASVWINSEYGRWDPEAKVVVADQ